MVERLKLVQRSYFSEPKPREFISSGCLLLDLALGGGWAERRIANIVGDRSTGKTLVAIEAMTNFARKYPTGDVKYRETEAAFDGDYAAALGLPLERIDFGGGSNDPLSAPKLETVEDLFEDLYRTVEAAIEENPTLYVVDSLDALSDRAELARAIDKGSYGMAKPKILSELFRRLAARASAKNVTLLLVSQVRSNITKFAFAKQYVRSGGKALDFYCSQVLSLSQISVLKRTVGKVTRPTGISVKGQLDKNKVSLPFRTAEFDVIFGYGIDDYKASIKWLEKNIGAKAVEEKMAILLQAMRSGNQDVIEYVNQVVTNNWYAIEQSFLPKRGKYT